MTNLIIRTIYQHPADYPDKWVMRAFTILRGGIAAAGEAVTADSLEAIRALVPEGCVRLARDPTDDPVIYESWV